LLVGFPCYMTENRPSESFHTHSKKQVSDDE
jgi:hypothetical protein